MFDLNSLNKQQREAVSHIDGPLLLLAGAGSGKTRVITCRIVFLLEQCGVPAEQILAVTFTNKAAREMRERIEEMVGRQVAKGVTVTTFHSLCVRFLKADIDRLGFKKNFSIYGAVDQQRLVRDLLREEVDDTTASDAEQVLWKISDAKNRLIRADKYQADSREPITCLVALVYPRYQKALKAFNAVDFDDLLMFAVQLLEQNPDLLQHYQQQFRYQMVDEYQDTNSVQYRLLTLLAGGHGNLCVVGDDDQSIYGWRGADIANILDFEKDFPSMRLIKLEQNYRSSANILSAANAVIQNNNERRDKVLWTDSGDGAPVEYVLCEDDEDEARLVMERIHAERYRLNLAYKDFAILYRTNTQSRAFEEQLRYENIPYVLIGGQQFFDRKEVRDVLAYLRVVANPTDEVNLLRIINYPKRGIGETSIDKLIRTSSEQDKSLWNVLERVAEVPEVNERTAESVSEFRDLIVRYQQRFKQPLRLGETLHELLQELKLADEIYRQEKDLNVARRRIENQQEVVNAMSAYLEREEKPSLAGFLDKVSLLDDDGQGRDDKEKKLAQDSVTLMSLHSSKGLEFPVVFLVGMEEGFLPHKKSIYETFDISEERRLCYVGITRAEKQLIMLGAKQRRKYGKLEQREPSRFLAELPDSLLKINSASAPEVADEKQQEKNAESFFSGISDLLDS